MGTPAKRIVLLLIIGVFMTFASAASFTCLTTPINGTSQCANITLLDNVTNVCTPTFQQYACSSSSILETLTDDILVNLSSCYSNDTIKNLDPVYATLFFSKLNSTRISALFGQLRSALSSLDSEWRKFLLFGIWPQLMSNPVPANVQPFFVHVNPAMVTCLSQQNVSCGVFREIVRNLNAVFTSMSADTAKLLYPPMKSFLDNQKNFSGSACSQNLNSSEWINQNLARFSQFGDLSDFTGLVANFSALDALSLLTITQVASFSLNQNNSAAIDSILAKLPDANAVIDFLNALNNAASLKNVSTVQAYLSQGLLNKTFTLVVSVSTYSSNDWSQLFQNKISMFLPEITAQQLGVIPKNISCDSYQAIVGALDSKFQQMAPGNKEAVFKTLIQPYLQKQGSACFSNGTSTDLFKRNYGQFSKYATYADLLGANFSVADVLPLLTTQQIASFSVDVNNGNNPTTISNILAALPNTAALLEFLTAMNNAALQNNVTSLPAPLAQALMNSTFNALKANFSSYKSSDWTTFVQNQVFLIFQGITQDQLSFILQILSCDSFQAIVGALDFRFQQIASGNQAAVFNSLIQPYLQKKDPACTPKGNSTALLKQNFGQFLKYASYSDLVGLGANFSVVDVLPLLTIPQIANFIVDVNATINSTTISNIFAALPNANAVQGFFSAVNTAAQQNNVASLPALLAQTLMNSTFNTLKTNFSSYQSSDWKDLMQSQLGLILPEITPDQLSLIPQNLSCDSFQAIVKGMDLKFKQMSAGKQETVYKSLIKPFLGKQGSACSQNLNSSALINQNFGRFSQFANYSDFQALNSNFSAVSPDVLPLLTISQKVGFSFAGNFIDAPTIVGSLQNANDVQAFLDQFNAAAVMQNVNMVQANLSQALLSKTFGLLLANISAWNSSDLTQLFKNKLPMFLSEITPQQIGLIPQNISCDSYQALVGSLDLNFQKMTPGNQEAIFKSLIQPYVKKQGPACSPGGNSNALLKQNFGQFFKYANYSDLLGLGANFSALDVLSNLTIQQLVDFTVNATINPTTASRIAANLKVPSDVVTFLSSFKTVMPAKVDPALSRALLGQTFQVLQPTFNDFSTQNWTQLFQDQIAPFLPQISPDQLKSVPKNISCDSYQPMVKSMDSVFSQMPADNQQGIYKNFIRPYLTRTGNAVVCYNQSVVNSSAWLATNMASFMTYTSEEDLVKCADTATLQTFASDATSLNLASQLKLTSDAGKYYTTLLTSNPNVGIIGLPPAFLCFLSSDALKTVNSSDASGLISKINLQCFKNISISNPSPKDIQVAMSLVSKISNLSSDNIIGLGQSAVGLSVGQINNISDNDLKSSVSSLASVSGWNDGQARSIVARLLNANYTISNLTTLGSLVSGLPTKTLSNLPQAVVLSAAKDPQFVSKLSAAPPSLQNQFVQQLIVGDTNATSLVNNVPASLVSFIPSSKLLSKGTKLSLSDVNGKNWTASQAAMFFDDLILATSNYTDISSSVMQGFTCVTPNKIDNGKLRNLVKAMKTQNVTLSEDQVTCLSRQVVSKGFPSDLDQYPKEIFLYFNTTAYIISTNATCKDYFTNVGAANVGVLQKGASQRSALLSQALTCLNVTGYAVTSANAQVLGQLVCDLNSTYIDSSYSDLVSNMAQCKSFTSDQQTSIVKVLSKGTSSFGAASSWSKDTLNSLGAMSGLLNKDILSNISTISLISWLTDAIPNKLLTRTQFSNLIQIILSNTKAKRATGCTVGAITADNVNDDTLPVKYTASQLDACLDSSILSNYLQVLTSKPFTTDQLNILKNKLDALYPSGYPEGILPSLGGIAFLCSDTDINKWSISSVDTLQGLLSSATPSNVTKSVIGKYISSGNTLTTNAINVIGSNICLLTSAQVDPISSTALGEAKPLDLSTCSQALKDSLYSKQKTYSQGVTSDTSAYFNLIKSYLGGAPLADLKTLAASSPNMDIGTFTTLNSAVVVGLSVSDVKNLLGNNTADLTTQVKNPVVNAWISSQKQSDLDTLGLNIQGGIKDTSATTTTATTIKASSSSPAFTQSLSFILVIVAAIFLF